MGFGTGIVPATGARCEGLAWPWLQLGVVRNKMDRNIEMYCGVGLRFMKFMSSEFNLLKLWVMIEEDISQISKKWRGSRHMAGSRTDVASRCKTATRWTVSWNRRAGHDTASLLVFFCFSKLSRFLFPFEIDIECDHDIREIRCKFFLARVEMKKKFCVALNPLWVGNLWLPAMSQSSGEVEGTFKLQHSEKTLSQIKSLV